MPVSPKNLTQTVLDRDQRKALMETVQAFEAGTRRRGTLCLLNGCVDKVAFQDGVLISHVNESVSYRAIWWRQNGHWRNECACPVGVDCKHTYAVAQYVLQHLAPLDHRTEPTDFTRSMDTHIDHLLSLVGGGKKRPPSSPSTSSSVSRILEARSSWDALQFLLPLLADFGIEAKGTDPRWISFLEAESHDKRAWLLTREFLKYGDRLPAELEPYRHREDFEREEAEKREESLVVSLQGWVQTLSLRPPNFQRSIRVVWRWDPPSSVGSGPQISLLLSSKKLKDAPRSFQQMRGFASEAARSPNLFSPDDADFLRWLDSQSHLLSRNDSYRSYSASLVRSGRALHAWLAVWGQSSRCSWEDGAWVRYDGSPARIVPEIATPSGPSDAAKPSCGLPSLGFAVELADGKRFPLEEARVVLPPDDTFKEPTFVFVDGVFHLVASPPPRSVLQSFLGGERLPLSASRRGALLAPLISRFPDLAGNAAGLIRHDPVRISFTFLLQPNDWLCVRVFAVSRKTRTRWEFTREGWIPCGQTPDPSAVLEPLFSQTASPAPAAHSNENGEGGNAQSAMEDQKEDCEYLPDPSETEPSQAWLESLGTRSAEDADLEEGPGWWTFLTGKRIEELFEQWAARPAAAEYWANPAFRNLFHATRRRPRLKIRSSGMDWLSVSANWESLAEGLTSVDLGKLRDGKCRFIKLSNGHWIDREEADPLHKTLEMLADLGLDPTSKEPQKMTLWQLIGAKSDSVEAWLEMLGSEADPETQLALRQLKSNLENFQGLPEAPLPARIQASMRPYQIEGLKFLNYVSGLKLGAILADDMGLGKTLQALAWMERLREVEGPAPCLVVCPASVVYNWQREAEKFVPGAEILLLTSGEARHAMRKEIHKHDLVITNYALLRRDLEELKRFEFRAVVLDEAQNIKNPDSIVARAAKQLRAVHRLALTGTPLENRLLDLWSIADFVAPGYLGTRTRFSEMYDAPDQPHRRRLLAARLRPFLLRRIKRDVAPDLPDRIEERQDCELTEGQRSLYLAELRQARNMVSQMDGEELPRKKIHILAALTRLRQICCHPELAGGKPDLGSGKTAALFDILEPLIAEGHKVLVFSQFVRMLRLLQRELNERSIPHHILTGQTAKREETVDAFQRDSRAGIFLLSLRAAGTGLNLTAASYVVLYDPWWNPAVEAQAIDRTHRIGQDRTVITYRLVAKGTVEDKIYELQQRKASVVKDVLGEEGFARSLTRDDLEFLFAD